MIKVEVVYVPLTKNVVHRALDLNPGATVSDALHASGIYEIYPEARTFPVGIFSKQVSLEHVLKEGDRIEIYRPLVLDPKESRRKKASILTEKNKS
ncbi:RnfH family protein [Legionella longbeachae]|uniref:RnfH family protein n=1 Tax=Legionella longbeachae TaxID=450 RepID=UPI0012463D9C|nr:RnfH family protein [Legionella longbeachae]QEY50511.1 RnfH family protein [Legionella longbeachae]